MTSLNTFRNATFPAAVRDELEEAANLIENVAKDVAPANATSMWPLVDAIRYVVEQWDNNDGTGFVLPWS